MYNLSETFLYIVFLIQDSCPLRNIRTQECVGNETEYNDNRIYISKESYHSYVLSKGDGYSDQYTLKYFQLN